MTATAASQLHALQVELFVYFVAIMIALGAIAAVLSRKSGS